MSHRTILPLILMLACLLRLGLPCVAYYSGHDKMVFHNPDTASYVSTGISLVTTGKFEQQGRPEIVRTPGYPVLLALGLLLGQVEFYTIIIQTILSCLTVYLVFHISMILFLDARIALVSATLYSMEPLSIRYTSLLITETLFCALTTTFVYLLIRYLKEKTFRHIFGAALALSAAVYVRPLAYYLFFFVSVVLMIWVIWTQVNQKRLFGHLAFFFIFCFVAIGIWQARNYTQTGYIGFSAIKDINLYFYNGAAVNADKRGVPFSEQQHRMALEFARMHPQCPDIRSANVFSHDISGHVECLEYMRESGKEIIWKNLPCYFKVHLKGILRTLFGPGTAEFHRLLSQGNPVLAGDPLTASPLPTLLLAAILLLLEGFALVGFMSNVHRNPSAIAVILAIICYLVAVASNGYSRFRHPVMPLFCVFAGAGINRALQWIKALMGSRWQMLAGF